MYYVCDILHIVQLFQEITVLTISLVCFRKLNILYMICVKFIWLIGRRDGYALTVLTSSCDHCRKKNLATNKEEWHFH